MIVGQRLGLPFSRAEKVMGILRDLDVPLVRVVSAEPLRGSWWRAVRGWRVGFTLPGVRLLGTWRPRRRRHLVVLRRGQPSRGPRAAAPDWSGWPLNRSRTDAEADVTVPSAS